MDVQQSPTLHLHQRGIDALQSLSHQIYKKRIANNEDDPLQFETIRKKRHPNEDIFLTLAETVKKEPATQDKEGHDEKGENIFYAESISITPLRQKYAMLIPDYQLAEYSLDQKMLLRIQSRLDEHLLYLKVHRGKKKGQFFKSLRKNLIQGCQIIMELQHLKQILFLDSTFYICIRQKDKEQAFDILVDLPQTTDLNLRKLQFKQKLFKYLQQHNAFETAKKKYFSIPLYKFPFEEQIQYNNQMLLSRREEELIEHQIEEAKQENESITNAKNVFNKSFCFKEKLYKQIEEKQAKRKERTEGNLEDKRYGRQEVLKVADEIYLIYTSKKICNMFQVTLSDLLMKKMLILDDIVQQIIQFIISNNFGYLKKIDHSKGVILQIELKNYRNFRERIKEMEI